jgi:hypothetical protein
MSILRISKNFIVWGVLGFQTQSCICDGFELFYNYTDFDFDSEPISLTGLLSICLINLSNCYLFKH